MPLTDFQHSVLKLIKQNRNPDSYVAGGIAINREQNSARFSADIDFFHDLDDAVTHSFNLDSAVLKKNGYEIHTTLQQPQFIRAVTTKGSDSLKLEWVRDTAFRFFPVLEDELLGYRLHDADLAINKCLALANRNEVRDIIDLIALHNSTISIAAACWAACGKDPGFSPPFLFDCLRRNSIIRNEALDAEALTSEVNPVTLKREWIELLDKAESTCRTFPAEDLGCLYVDKNGNLIRSPEQPDTVKSSKHFGVIRGSWPRVINPASFIFEKK